MFGSSIDLHRRFVETFQSHGLTPFRGILTPEVFQACSSRLYRDSTILIPEVIFWLMATTALTDGVFTAAVAQFWTSLIALRPGLPLEPVTEEAFCKARKKLPLAFFRKLFAEIVSRYHQAWGHAYRWKGLELLGIDGTLLTLSPLKVALRLVFPSTANQNSPSKYPLARLVGLVGLRDGFCRDFLLGPLSLSEQSAARVLIGRSLRKGQLLLCDRNFSDYHTLACLSLKKADFLFRLHSNRFIKGTRRPTPSGEAAEYFLTLVLPAALRRQYPQLPATLQVRVLHYQIDGFRPSRLVTSLLDTELYPYHELVPLYHLRWSHETVYRDWKQTLQLSNLRSHTQQGVLKEVFVQITINNVIRWIQTEATAGREPPLHLQFLKAKRLLFGAVVYLTVAVIKAVPRLYRKLLAQIAAQKILKRPGRRYPRAFDSKSRYKGGGVWVLPARLGTEVQES